MANVDEALPRAPIKHGPRGGKKANLSPLMQALETASENEVVNACPFGCADEELDTKGACVHLIGITLPVAPGATPTQYEVLEPPDVNGNRKINGNKIHKVQKGDKLFRITSSYRVYRENPEAAE